MYYIVSIYILNIHSYKTYYKVIVFSRWNCINL